VPFNAIVLGLGHIRATADGTSSVGTVADKMDLVQMMLDCAETMTSVLDDVTDMGEHFTHVCCDLVCLQVIYKSSYAFGIVQLLSCSW
jgi:hypothetical protein